MTGEQTGQQPTLPDARTIERALRSCGLSRRAAKALMSEGIRAIGLADEHDEHDEHELADQLRQAAKALRDGS